MGRRDALFPMKVTDDPYMYLREAIWQATGTIRIEVGWALSIGTTTSNHCGFSLWENVGVGNRESWQRLTTTIMTDTYSEAMELVGRAMDTTRGQGRLNKMASGGCG